MLDSEILGKIKAEYRFFVEITFIFSLLLAIGYAWGYWSTFSVNIFPFLTLSDLIKSTAYPILLVVPYLLLQLFILELHPIKIPFLHKIKPEHMSTVPTLLMPVSIFLGLWLKSITLIFGIPSAIMIFTLLKKNVSPNKHKTIRIILVLGILVFVSFDIGKYNAHIIYSNKEYSYSSIDMKPDGQVFKYLGYINNNYFFLTTDNSLLIIKHDLNQLALKKFLRKNEPDNSVIGFT